ncbi:MAG: hypothetical protein ACK5X3_05970 [Pseudomonadota bacterium]|jgi:hypothetical protein
MSLTKSAPIKFTSLSTANSFVNNAIKSMAVMMGDDNKFWVVTMADAQRLEKVGYEWA